MTVSAIRVARTTSAVLAFGVFALAMTPTSHAGPVVLFDLDVFGGDAPGSYSNSFNSVGNATANPQIFNHIGSQMDPNGVTDWSLAWDFNSDTDPSVGQASLGAGFTFENLMADQADPAANHLHVIINLTLSVLPPGLPATFGGNAGMTLTIRPDLNFSNDGELNTFGNNAMWTYLINGANNGTLYAPGFQLAGQSPQQGDATLNTNQTLSSFQFNQPVSDIGIRIEFDLTPGEKVTFNGVFAFIPAPGALALFGLAGLCGRGRRRA
jgi:hypothetical protein